jgi:sigma-B regulation protein RsbU (phosphoserine phosphatase)
MLSVSVHNLLQSGTVDDDTLRDPGRVLTELNQLFQMERQAGNYFTIWYGVYQPSARMLRYAGAGHPPALILTADGSEPARLPSGSVPIGILDDATFRAHSHPLPTHAELLIYSDGAFDLPARGDREWALEDFIDLCDTTARSPHWTLEDLVGQLRDQSETGHFGDDCTLVRVGRHSLPEMAPEGDRPTGPPSD